MTLISYQLKQRFLENFKSLLAPFAVYLLAAAEEPLMSQRSLEIGLRLLVRRNRENPSLFYLFVLFYRLFSIFLHSQVVKSDVFHQDIKGVGRHRGGHTEKLLLLSLNAEADYRSWKGNSVMRHRATAELALPGVWLFLFLSRMLPLNFNFSHLKMLCM